MTINLRSITQKVKTLLPCKTWDVCAWRKWLPTTRTMSMASKTRLPGTYYCIQLSLQPNWVLYRLQNVSSEGVIYAFICRNLKVKMTLQQLDMLKTTWGISNWNRILNMYGQSINKPMRRKKGMKCFFWKKLSTNKKWSSTEIFWHCETWKDRSVNTSKKKMSEFKKSIIFWGIILYGFSSKS